jgi:hypothetical protein
MTAIVYATIDHCKMPGLVLPCDFNGSGQMTIVRKAFPRIGPIVVAETLLQIARYGGLYPLERLKHVRAATDATDEEVYGIIAIALEEHLLTQVGDYLTGELCHDPMDVFARKRIQCKKSDKVVYPWEPDSPYHPHRSTIGQPEVTDSSRLCEPVVPDRAPIQLNTLVKSNNIKLDSVNSDWTPPLGVKQLRPFVWMSDIDADNHRASMGRETFERACDKLNGWVGESQGTGDFPKRLQRGRNAAFTISNWVGVAVQQERAKVGGVEKDKRPPGPVVRSTYVPPTPEQSREATPEERARVSAIIRETFPEIDEPKRGAA